MRRIGWKSCTRYAAIALMLLIGAPNAVGGEVDAPFPGEPINEQVVSVLGDLNNPVHLVVTILTPSGSGPFPLAVMNHGANGSTVSPEKQPRYRRSLLASYFLSRGYAVAMPMMRGYSGSEGKEMLAGCGQEAIGRSNAKDLLGVLNFVTRLPFVDGNRIVMTGQSFGGWNTLAFGTLNYGAVKGLVNMVGGVNLSSCRAPKEALGKAAGHFGAETKAPSIWFYGDNDSQFPPDVWRTMYERYTAAGGKAELVAFGRFMDDSHLLTGFPESFRIFSPRLDAFLERIGMPNKVMYQKYLPMDFPPATNFAAIGDEKAIPYVSEEGRVSYRHFLAAKAPKVFVLSSKGMAGAFFGGADPLGRAMKVCAEKGHVCRVYAADDDVVWSRPTPTPPPSHFASIGDVSAVPLIDGAGRKAFEKYGMLPIPKVFVISGEGRWFLTAMGDDPVAMALDACRKKSRDCQPYAVDNEVVWTKK